MESLTKNKKTKDQIIHMVQAAFGEAVKSGWVSVRELTDGYFNVAYEVILPDREMILKIAPPKNSKVLSYEQNCMEAEVAALRIVKEKTAVPVPAVYFYDNTHRTCDSDYFFMEKLTGTTFCRLKQNGMPQTDQETVLREIGRYNHEMNLITGEFFGCLGKKEKLKKNWSEAFLSMISDILNDGEAIDISLGTGYDEIRHLIDKAAPALKEVNQPQFVHWDLWDGNVFINEGKISGLIDFERALWGDPLMEYYFRSISCNTAFNDGYGQDLRKMAPVRALLYDIYLYLIMVIETKYRNYPDNGQYNFAVKELAKVTDELSSIL